MGTRVFFFLLMAVCIPLACFSQYIVPALTFEKNVAGCEYGVTLAYQTKSLISLGAFYQTGWPLKTEGIQTQRNFTGALLNIPVAKSQNLNFFLQVRTGFVGQRFLVFVPGVETEIHVVSNLWIHAGAGLRMTYPLLTTKISFKI